MKRTHSLFLVVFVVFSSILFSTSATAQGSAFTYQGRLASDGAPANGSYDLTFTLFDSTNVSGNVIAGPVTNSALAVSNGLFTVQLDFGAGVFDGSDRWLEIGVRTNGNAGAFTLLSPLQQITSMPYSIQSLKAASAAVAASANSVSATNINGAIALAQLPTAILTNGASGVTISGTFAGNGAGVSNVPASWQTVAGTSLTVSGNQSYLLTNNTQTSVTLPASANVGDIVTIAGVGNSGWQVTANSGQGIVGYPGFVWTGTHNGILPGDGAYWAGLASSADGTKLVATDARRNIYTSTNSGGSWMAQSNGITTPSQYAWGAAASSADGTKLIVAGGQFNTGGPLFTSTDSGSSWTAQTSGIGNGGNQNWSAIACSTNGTKIAATTYQGPIFLSTDSGATWTQSGAPSDSYVAIASSADGTKLIAMTFANNFYTSTNSGSTWTLRTISGYYTWQTVVSSSDGTRLLAGTYNGQIFTSTNSGVNWTQQNSSAFGGGRIYSMAGSSDCVHLIAGVFNGLLCASSDGGASWTPQNNAGSGAWAAVASSSDGAKLTALLYGGYPNSIYTSTSQNVSFAGTAGTTVQFQYVGNGLWQPLGAPAGQIVGTLSPAQLPGSVVYNGQSGVGLNGGFSGSFSGDGSGLANLNASQLTGTIPLAVENSAVVTNTENNVTLSGVFSGDGSGLTNLNASKIASGSLGLAQLPGAVLTNGASSVNISGTFSGNGAGVTNVNLYSLNSYGAFAPAATNWGAFTLASTLAAGVNPIAAIAADVNGDGKMDLICANSDDFTLSIYTNIGGGTFGLSATVGVGREPYSVAAADVNGDGKMDLITANYSDGTLTVLTNNGRGGFAVASSPAVGQQPTSVIAADVNNDGKMDLIAANYIDSTLSILTNNGTGGFVTAATVTTGNNTAPVTVVAGDFNGDGKMDLATANDSGSATILTNNGTGGFALAATLSAPGILFGPQSIAAADVNNDNKMDLITVNGDNNGHNTLTVWTNNGHAGFTTSVFLTNNVGAVAAADINGDGSVDLISQNFDYPNQDLTVWTNNGSGGFAISSINYFAGQQMASFVVAADLNGDGQTDLVAGMISNDHLWVLTNAPVSISTSFVGSGSGLTGLNAAQISSGTIAPGRLPSIMVTNTQTGVALSGTFGGNGGGLTNLNAAQISSGTIAPARLPSIVVTNTQTGVTLGGTFSGNGAGLTGLNASSLGGSAITTNSSGVVLGGALNANVNPIYLKAPGDGNHGIGYATSTTNFSGLNAPDGPVLWGYNGGALGSMNGGAHLGLVWTKSGVGIGATNPASALHVASSSGDVEISLQSGDAGNHRWTLQSSGSSTPGLVSSFQIIDRTAGASRMTIYTNGNVTIPGNVTNSGSVIVNGSATFNGATKVGVNPVTVGNETLRIVRGEITGSGTVDFGTGFTVAHNSTGDYVISYTTSFNNYPAFTATSYGSILIPTIFINAAGSVEVKFYNTSGSAADPAGFDFIAIGP